MAQYGIQWDSNALDGKGEVQWIKCQPPNRFLIKQNGQYYSIKSNFYCLGQPQSDTQLEKWYEKYGVDNPNKILEQINNEKIIMKHDKENQIWITENTIDLNKIKNSIEVIENDNNKIIKYDVEPYRIIDVLNEETYLTKIKK